jgi:hypothetical protein
MDETMFRTAILFLVLILPSPAQAQIPKMAQETFFEAKIRPVLADVCFKCHGGAKTSRGLRVDTRGALLQGGESGPAVKPGDPDASLLLQALRHSKDDLRMPPDQKLPDHVLKDFAAWIKQGAFWPQGMMARATFTSEKHWAYRAVQGLAPPDDSTGWARHPVDRFIIAKLRAQGLVPVGRAERRALVRRATFDLIGLPPTPEEVEAFAQDEAPDALAKVVDRLLASPRYGERWGRHWMDVVRYADTAGDNADYPIPEIHRYRDWIIDAFNADMPYDQFVQEQLAGDLLAKNGPPDKYAGQVIATGFLALARRYATAPFEFWHLSLEDAIDTTGQAFLGLSLRCARCHDHKFDPVTRADYYGLYAIFASTVFPYAGSEEFASKNSPRQNFVPLVLDAGVKIAGYQQRLKELSALLAKDMKKEQQALREEQRVLHRLGAPLDLPVAYAVQDGKVAEVRIHLQGDPDKPGPTAPRYVPKFIEGEPVKFPEKGSGRLELARWLTRPDHPLTARVLVNRIWQHHFGRGLVATPNNFGLRGERPSHPELLDHLAAEFLRHNWSIKWLHRYIMSSETYQLASEPFAELVAKDPSNIWLGHYPRRRLDAEALRDALLAVSGKLDCARPGAQPFPPITKWGWTQHAPFKDIYPSNHRSVYLMTQRFQKHPFLALFDGPDTNASTGQRADSLLPLQALYLMNDPFVHEQAEGFARRLTARAAEPERRIAWAYQFAWGRPPTMSEVARGIAYLERCADELRRAQTPEERVELDVWTSYARVLLAANEFVFVD